MELKQIYNIATKVISRKCATTFDDLPDLNNILSIVVMDYSLTIRPTFDDKMAAYVWYVNYGAAA